MTRIRDKVLLDLTVKDCVKLYFAWQLYVAVDKALAAYGRDKLKT